MRILVTGTRDWPKDTQSRAGILVAISDAAGDTPAAEVTVVHGGARGVDTFAHQAALILGFTPEVHPAPWNAPCRDGCKHKPRKHPSGAEYCPAAGNYRNQEMIDAGADVCVAFYVAGLACTGTSDCDQRAVKAGIPVVRIGAA